MSAFTYKLEREDGTPADPPTFRTAVTMWQPGDTIPLNANRTLQVVRVRDDGADQPPVACLLDRAAFTDAPHHSTRRAVTWALAL
jgi:hypothetical protein